MKTCSKCRIEKPLSDFYRFIHSKDGYGSECKACANQRTYAYRKANPDRVREIRRRSYWRNPEANREARKRWRAAHPEKVRAMRWRWIEQNPEKYEQHKRYKPERRDYFREYMRAYRAKRREEASV